MYLLGAREFIKMPTGTFYEPYWENTKEECLRIICQFKKEPTTFLNITDLHVFGDNSGSMSFTGNKEDDYIFYYDANVVGDADPSTTLYLVLDENELPDIISIYDDENNIIKLTKDEVIKIKNIFINNLFDNYKMDEWAVKYLDTLSEEYNSIVDVNIRS